MIEVGIGIAQTDITPAESVWIGPTAAEPGHV